MTQNKMLLYALYGLRKAGRKLGVFASPTPDSFLCSQYVELFDQEANDFVYETLRKGEPCMISKFGTTELNAVVTALVTSGRLSLPILKEFLGGGLVISDSIYPAVADVVGIFPCLRGIWPDVL